MVLTDPGDRRFLPRDAMPVRLSHAGILSKQLCVLSNFVHRRVERYPIVFRTKPYGSTLTGTPPNGGVECKGYEKTRFSTNISLYRTMKAGPLQHSSGTEPCCRLHRSRWLFYRKRREAANPKQPFISSRPTPLARNCLLALLTTCDPHSIDTAHHI